MVKIMRRRPCSKWTATFYNHAMHSQSLMMDSRPSKRLGEEAPFISLTKRQRCRTSTTSVSELLLTELPYQRLPSIATISRIIQLATMTLSTAHMISNQVQVRPSIICGFASPSRSHSSSHFSFGLLLADIVSILLTYASKSTRT